MQFSQSFLDGIIKFLYSLERYFHVVLKTDRNISFSTTPSVVIAKKLECEVISRYLYLHVYSRLHVDSKVLSSKIVFVAPTWFSPNILLSRACNTVLIRVKSRSQ